MEKKIVLEIGDNPILSSNPSYSYKTLLIQNAGKKATNIFLANHFTNCIYEPHFFDLYEEDYYFEKEDLFSLHCFEVYTSNVIPDYSKIVFQIANYLASGYYAITHWDLLYQPQSTCFETKHYDIEHIIYGIDFEKREIFIISGLLGKIQKYAVSFDCYFTSKLVFNAKKIDLTFVRPDDLKNKSIDVTKIKYDLNDFLSSKSRFYLQSPDWRQYGLEAINSLIGNLYGCDNLTFFDMLQSVDVFCDHIISMYITIQMLAKMNKIYMHFHNRFYPVFSDTTLLRKICRDSGLYNSGDFRDEVINLINKIRYEEEIIIRNLINSL